MLAQRQRFTSKLRYPGDWCTLVAFYTTPGRPCTSEAKPGKRTQQCINSVELGKYFKEFFYGTYDASFGIHTYVRNHRLVRAEAGEATVLLAKRISKTGAAKLIDFHFMLR